MISQLTIDLPLKVAQRLADLAAEQKKSVETVAVEKLSASLETAPSFERGSPAGILLAMKSWPRVNAEYVDEMERMIEAGRLPVSDVGIFDEEIGS
jgi:hypothetical protein